MTRSSASLGLLLGLSSTLNRAECSPSSERFMLVVSKPYITSSVSMPNASLFFKILFSTPSRMAIVWFERRADRQGSLKSKLALMHLRQQLGLELFADPPSERETADDQRNHHARTGQRPANELRINPRIGVRTVDGFPAAKLCKQPRKLRADLEQNLVAEQGGAGQDPNGPNQRQPNHLQQE